MLSFSTLKPTIHLFLDSAAVQQAMACTALIKTLVTQRKIVGCSKVQNDAELEKEGIQAISHLFSSLSTLPKFFVPRRNCSRTKYSSIKRKHE